MKKKSIFLSCLMAAGLMATAQSPRMSLLEEFTGENCGPCAATNPGLNTILQANTSKCIAIKWQVPIPSAPTNTWSSYQEDHTEIDWRWMATYYNMSYAPSTQMDGQSLVVFGAPAGATQDHAANVTTALIANSSAVPAPFTIAMNRSWVAPYNSIAVTVTVTASQAFTAAGSLVFRLVMVERQIHFATAPGSNGEKDFYDVARASFPTIQNGTALPATWTVGQTSTFTVNCNIPAYIWDKSEIGMVGFVQDDGNKKVEQAALSGTVALTNDAAATSISGSAFSCGNTYSPTVVLTNNGSNSITNMTITPAVDGLAGAPFFFAGTLAPGASTTMAAPTVTAASGSHTYSINITGVSGTDYNLGNNSKQATFVLVNSYFPAPVTEPFTVAVFPPANWFTVYSSGPTYWSRSASVGGYGVGAGSALYDFYNNANIGVADDMYITPLNLTGVSNPTLTFDVAYAQYSNETDNLTVKVSSNCGATWTTVYSKTGATLATAPSYSAGLFVPTAAQWRTEGVSLATFANMPQVLVKFTATSDYGNEMYIDNVNLAANTTGIKTNVTNVTSVELFPNPAQTEANIRVSMVQPSDVTINVINAIGQNVSQKALSLNGGDNVVSLDIKGLASGIYSVIIDTKEGPIVKKLTVSK